MKNNTLFFLIFCFMTFHVSSQNINPEKEKEKKRLATKPSSVSLQELLAQKNDAYVVTDENVSTISGVRNIYLRQAINGLGVLGTESSIHFDNSGAVLAEHNKFLADIKTTLKSSAQGISARQAITSVANQMGYSVSNLQEKENHGGKSKSVLFNKANISSENIPVKLMYYYQEGVGTELIWELSIAEVNSSDWWNFRVNAATGQIIDKINWTVSCNIMDDHNDHFHSNTSEPAPFIGPMPKPINYGLASGSLTAPPVAKYRVFAMPVENPNYGTRTLVTSPENLNASPYGWHDTNGMDGAEYTNTRGNNTDAYDDDNANDNPDGKFAFSPGGNLVFDFPLNLNYSYGDQSEDAAVTNLFYWTNIIHDVTYQYGFDEASGNFQYNNYGKGGAGNDPVNAEAQDGSGTCNANFGTPADGSRPRMQMYVCDSRDGDLDNSVIIHEYGHGISNRLTGGPSSTFCLQNQEQMGEGWSDFYGLMLTMEPGDTGSDYRGVGTWLIGEGPGGPGIRVHPYSTDFGINPHTYDGIKSAIAPHGVGEIWATMLWEMTWEIMATEPYDSDIYNGTGGNNVALALVTEGLKLQPCSPGFIDGRDAILAADQALYGGAHVCAIWEAFARRGLGYSASQGSSGSKSDGTEAFDLPPSFSSLDVVDEVCLAGGVQTGLSGGNPAGGVYSGPGVTDDGNGSTFTFDPSVGGEGLVTVTYEVNDFCTGAPATLTDDINVTNNPPEIICVGSGVLAMNGSESSTDGGSIPDGNSSGLTVTMDVTENVSITDLDVNVDIAHTWVGDISVTIKSPSGTTATIIDRPGRVTFGFGCSGNDIDATLDDEAATPVEDECGSSEPTIDGSFIPNNPLSVFDGENTAGTWELKVVDNAGGDSGSLNGWGIDYDYEITAPVLDVVLDSNGNATVNAEDLLYSGSVDCGDYTVLAGSPLDTTVSFTCADVGSNTVAVQATNDAGASALCSAIVNVIGNGTGGTLECPDDITQDNDPGVCGAEVSFTVDSPVGCSGGTLTQTAGLDSGSVFPIGTTTNTFEYDDGVNPVQTCSFDVTVNDTELPVAVCQDLTIQLDASGNASITAADVENGSSDNCGIDSMSIDTTSFTCADIGANNVTLTVVDENGNSSTCVAVVTVEDAVLPEITCPSDQSQDPGAGNSYIVPDYFGTGEASATDNCTDPITTTTQDPAPGTSLTDGTYTVTLTAEDESGNSATCSFELTVDTTAGVGDNADIGSIKMFPNPAKDKVMITNPQHLSLNNLSIFDLRGRLIKTVDMRNMGMEKSIDVSKLASSIYFVLIQGKDGQLTKKLIKE
ncbi:M36 family metallopeptidase [Aequorivita marina]|uniref:M36 family metallopeptidase n=1 Tax=Aequorivita marina TaxID=3073654 RepID=UPI0028765A75|nr:M36 family metallopeptidase [Aequorivita sp. S2608]MDS1298118.1 M36 family metallopeptidase [Aequorivita sp. S2608]